VRCSGAFIEYWGFKSIHGRIWTYLALRDEPVSQKEIVDVFEVSRALVSGAMSELVEFNLVRPCGEHRNAPYESNLEVWSVISGVLRSREWMLVERARLALEGAIAELEVQKRRGELGPYNMERLRFLLSMSEVAQTFLKIVMGIRTPRSIEQLGRWMRSVQKISARIKDIV
jgi:DNA-binding transcriptional regulator GbsR (MarR family)